MHFNNIPKHTGIVQVTLFKRFICILIGVTVNAKLMHLDLPSGHKSRQTFFDTAAVILGEDRITVGLNGKNLWSPARCYMT